MFPIRKINQELKRKNQQFTNSPLLSRTDDKTAITQKQAQLKEYKDQLEALNEKVNQMFEHMKQINKLVSQQIMEVENKVTKSEAIFVDEINRLLKNRAEIAMYQKKKNAIGPPLLRKETTSVAGALQE